MAVPKKKTSKSKNKMRQTGKGLTKKLYLKLDKNGEISMSHRRIVSVRKKKKIVLIKEKKKKKAEKIESAEKKKV